MNINGMTFENREKLARALETTAMILRTDIPEAMGIGLNVDVIIEQIRELTKPQVSDE